MLYFIRESNPITPRKYNFQIQWYYRKFVSLTLCLIFLIWNDCTRSCRMIDPTSWTKILLLEIFWGSKKVDFRVSRSYTYLIYTEFWRGEYSTWKRSVIFSFLLPAPPLCFFLFLKISLYFVVFLRCMSSTKSCTILSKQSSNWCF